MILFKYEMITPSKNYYMYDSVEECKQDYKELGYQISYDMM